ncbi:MAG: hypothetical protein ACTSRC_19515 [Candidatus Helarchaeota archaeon]
MSSKVLQERIEALTENRDIFRVYVGDYYARGFDFPHSSYYFHKRVLDTIRTNEYQQLFKEDLFLEYVYATLSTWGLDRMDGGARLVEFETFKKSVLSNLNKFHRLFEFRLDTILEEEKEGIQKDLLTLFDDLIIMKSRSKLVGVSKALHHLLPDLVPPIDRKYTLNFFYQPKFSKSPPIKGNEEDRFVEIFDSFHLICKKLNLTNQDLMREWDTSIPKLIDNAIIGFVSEEMIPT